MSDTDAKTSSPETAHAALQTTPEVAPSEPTRTVDARLDEHQQAIADLRTQTGQHEKAIIEHADAIGDLRKQDIVHTKAIETNAGIAAEQFRKFGESLERNNTLQSASNDLKQKQLDSSESMRTDFAKAVQLFIQAVRSPRFAGFVIVGAILYGLIEAAVTKVFK